MKREEELLRQACAEIAQEEADQLERGLTPSDIRQAEQAYRRHRKKALSLIRRSAKTTRPIRVYLSAAAAAAVIFAAVYVSLNHSAPDPVTVSQPPTASVAPYYSPVPTAEPSPSPTSIPPTESPVFTDIPTTSPTKTPNSATTELVSPTFGEAPEVTPTLTLVPTRTPSPAPTQTPAPTATPGPEETVTPGYDTLRPGDNNDAVALMQERLIVLNYLSGTADGNYGNTTKAAVRAFQKANSLTVDGTAGQQTLSVLYSEQAIAAPEATATPKATATPAPDSGTASSTLRKGDKGDSVKSLQSRLIELGYLTGKADGVYGKQTFEAVTAFQQANKLSADGVAGSKTLTKLNSGSAVAKNGR